MVIVHPDADFLDDINGKLKEVLAYCHKRLQCTPCTFSIFPQFLLSIYSYVNSFSWMLLISYTVH